MNDLATQILYQLMVASAFLMGCALLAGALLGLLRHRFPRIHEIGWSIVLFQAVLVFQIPIAIPWQGALESSQSTTSFAIDGHQLGSSALVGGDAPNIASSYAIAEESMDSYLAEILLFIWVAVLLGLLFCWGTRYVNFIRNLPCWECDIEEWNQEWQEIVSQSLSPGRPSLFVSRDIGPLLCRWPSGYRLVIPSKLWHDLPVPQRRAILRHELAHYERHDVVKVFIANLLAAMHWFNPLAWYAARAYEDSVEWACDDIAMQSSGGTTHYAKALLSLGEFSNRLSILVSAVRGGSLSRRIRRVLSNGSVPYSNLRSGLALSLLIGLSMAHVVKLELRAQSPANQDSNLNGELHQVLSDQFFVTSVSTTFQKWRLQGASRLHNKNVTVYANVNCRTFFDAKNPELDLERFDFLSLRDALNGMRSDDGGAMAVWLEFEATSDGRATLEMTNRVEKEFENRMGSWDVGDVVFIKNIVQDGRDWTPLPKKNNPSVPESNLGNEDVKVFAITNAFSSYLAMKASSPTLGQVDVFIDVAKSLPLDATKLLTESEESLIRETISKLGTVNERTVQIVAHFEKPKDYGTLRMDQPQLDNDSDFQKEAAAYLMSLGFGRVGIGVEMEGGICYLSVHGTPLSDR